MPYITKEDRALYDVYIEQIAVSIERIVENTEGIVESIVKGPTLPGSINRARQVLCNTTYTAIRDIVHSMYTVPKYADYNEVIGMLECCRLELKRREAPTRLKTLVIEEYDQGSIDGVAVIINVLSTVFPTLEYPNRNRAGHLNYILTKLIVSLFKDFSVPLSILEKVKLEMYSDKVAPYEDLKIKQNGDVY